MFSEFNVLSNRGSEIPVSFSCPEGRRQIPLVIGMHGYRSSRHEFGMYDEVAKALCDVGIAMVRLDFPGNNDNKEDYINCTLKNIHADMDATIKYICEQYDFCPSEMGLLGYSMGGMAALTYLRKLQEMPVAVALWAPGVNLRSAVQRNWAMTYGGIVQMVAKADEEETVALADQWSKTTISQELLLDMLCENPLQDLRAYKGNVLVIGGEEDTILQSKDFHIAYHIAVNAKHRESMFLPGKDHDLGCAWGDEAVADHVAVRKVIKKTVDFFQNSFYKL